MSAEEMITFEWQTCKYVEHRRVSVKDIYGLILSADTTIFECIILIRNSYSERFNLLSVSTKSKLLDSLEQLLQARRQKYLWYEVPDKRLTRFCTTKKDDAEKGDFKRPGDIYLVNRDKKVLPPSLVHGLN